MTYLLNYYDRLFMAALEHLELVVITLFISIIIAAFLTVVCTFSKKTAQVLLGILSMIYSIPSLALLALMIPFTGLGKTTAVVVLTIYNQYLLLRNFLAGLENVDKGIVEAAIGMGMTHMQVLLQVKLPLSRKAILGGIHIALVSTVSIATIAASINAGGLGMILFDGLRTMNYAKIIWGSLLSAILVIFIDRLLIAVEKKL